MPGHPQSSQRLGLTRTPQHGVAEGDTNVIGVSGPTRCCSARHCKRVERLSLVLEPSLWVERPSQSVD